MELNLSAFVVFSGLLGIDVRDGGYSVTGEVRRERNKTRFSHVVGRSHNWSKDRMGRRRGDRKDIHEIQIGVRIGLSFTWEEEGARGRIFTRYRKKSDEFEYCKEKRKGCFL